MNAQPAPGLYVDLPEAEEEKELEPTPVADVCDRCGGSGYDCEDETCGICPTCGGAGYLR